MALQIRDFEAVEALGDVALARRAAAGEAGAFAELYRRHADRLTRGLAITSAALLTLGVITAGLMTGRGGLFGTPGPGLGGAVAAAPGLVAQLAGAPGAAALAAGPASAVPGGDLGGVVGGGPPSIMATVPSGEGTSAPPAGPTALTPAPGGNPGGNPPPPASSGVVGVAAGANAAGTTASASLGVGGGCTGASINGSPSCAPPPPGKQGVKIGVTTPVGPIVVGAPSISAQPVSPPTV